MVINHLDKLFVTSDAATIIREVEPTSLFHLLENSCNKLSPSSRWVFIHQKSLSVMRREPRNA